MIETQENNFEDFLIYKEFMCFDRTIYYLLKNWCEVKDIELFFIDRYIGFCNDEKEGWKTLLDGMKKMLFNKGIIEVVNVPVDKIREYIAEGIEQNDYKVISYAKFFYPDKEKPYPYTSYLIIEGYDDEDVVLTKLSNVEQKIRFKCNENELKNLLVQDNNTVELLLFRKSPIFEDIRELNCKDKVKYIVNDVYEYDLKYLNDQLQEAESKESEIMKNADYHKSRLDLYISEGVHRKNYSSFARRINEMVFPSFRCFEILKRENVIENKDLSIIKERLENCLDQANKSILSFIWTKDTKDFDKYIDKMSESDEVYNLFRDGFHKEVSKIIAQN